jgi:hypothetical protein
MRILSRNYFYGVFPLPPGFFEAGAASGNGNFLPASSLLETLSAPAGGSTGASEEQPDWARAPAITAEPMNKLNTKLDRFIAL